MIIPGKENTIIGIVVVAFVSIITTWLHEMAHMAYAGMLHGRKEAINVDMKHAVASVSMTHIWVWGTESRICAIIAGLVSDMFFLSCVSVLRLFFSSWILTTVASALWLRILWQFRFHRNCDGRLLLMTIMDTPELSLLEGKNRAVFNLFCIIGAVIEVLLVVFWGLLFLKDLFYIIVNLLQ